ncbi:MAG TPA: S8 family serine peptidase, partial [Verrucomicrobiota bacterium]|nr:S8 family serine peptidase [Verrucomicrobiota bacterium]
MWALVSVLLFVGAGVSWQIAEWQEHQKLKQTQSPATNTVSTSRVERVSTNSQLNAVITNSPASKPSIPIRLTNSDKKPAELAKSPTALLLQNAVIDTSTGKPLPIPSVLLSPTNSHSFIVQSSGPLNDAIRNGIKTAKAKIVSYIPNNAYLVRAESSDATLLAKIPGVQAVVNYEPYFKLSGELLNLMNENMRNRDSLTINVLGYDGQKEELKKELTQLGANFINEQNNPFGPQFTVEVGANILADVAKSDFVQIVEQAHKRASANDRSRVMVGVSLSLTNDANPLGLTGQGVMVNINDTGVDASHRDLEGRVTAQNPTLLTDPEGHGTHIAGTIAGNGAMSGTVNGAPGSPSNSNFRGMAPEATLYVQGANPVTGPPTDEELQVGAYRSKARISNNSWYLIGDYGYSLAAASYDIAVRDSIATEPGMQELLYVFCAGNSGSGDAYGSGGNPNTITAPGTAKNVITVGSTECARHITNEVVSGDETNAPFVSITDSDKQVASFSSRGNVGYGLEGIYGRFKPDVVAPGTLLISCRSQQYKDPTNSVSSYGSYIRNVYVSAVGTNTHSVYVPAGTKNLIIQILPNSGSPDPFPTLAIEADPGTVATNFHGNNRVTIQQPEEGTWTVDIINASQMTVSYDLRIIIVLQDEDLQFIEVMTELNLEIGPWYRFESGTSMSAGVVSGVLALLEEFYTKLGHTNSPAMMKALLINGARNLGVGYDYAVKNYVNHQGWGLINLTNSARESMTAGGEASWSIQLFDQDPSNALVTGQTHTRNVTASPSTNGSALRITLVWTDPPGNPAAGIKLVNDLDLVVTNIDTGEVYTGNNFEQQNLFTIPYTTNSTNAGIEFDYVNNVENVFINLATNGSRFSVSVVARRVNVNAITAHPDGIAQDYALVISVDEGSSLSVDPPPQSPPIITMDPSPFVKSLTNGVAMIKERVGANSPLLVYTNGMTNQWNFYAFTNNAVVTTMMVGTNSSFVT